MTDYRLSLTEKRLLEVLNGGDVWGFEDIVSELGLDEYSPNLNLQNAILNLRDRGYLCGGTEHCQITSAGLVVIDALTPFMPTVDQMIEAIDTWQYFKRFSGEEGNFSS